MNANMKFFSNLDKAFWVIWCALPLFAFIRIYYFFTAGYFNPDGSHGGDMPIIEFSLLGKVFVSTFLCVNVILYIMLLAHMHILVRQFRNNSLFVGQTLKYMQRIALLMMAWPIIKTVLYNLTSYVLVQLGDAHNWSMRYELDLPLISAGLVILALRFVMYHAIKLHLDTLYTV